MRSDSRQDHAAVTVVERNYPQHLQEVHRARPADGQAGQRRQGHRLEYRAGGRAPEATQRPVTEDGRYQGHAVAREDIDVCEDDPDAGAGDQRRSRASRPGRRWPRTPASTTSSGAAARTTRSFRDIQAQPRKIITSPTWSGIESEKVTYTPCYTNVHELIPWRTLTGRQHFYQDHEWMLASAKASCVYKPPIDMKTIKPIAEDQRQEADQAELDHAAPQVGHPLHLLRTTCGC